MTMTIIRETAMVFYFHGDEPVLKKSETKKEIQFQ